MHRERDAKMRRTRAAAYRAAASVEKADPHAGIATQFRESSLRFLQAPLAGDDAGIFVAVAVADHDLLDERQLFAAAIP